MKKQASRALIILSLALGAARADAVSAYYGAMDTELFGKGDLVGGALEISPVEFLSIQLRGGYADGFGEFNIKPPSTAGMGAYEARLNNEIFGALSGAGKVELKDFSIVPLEIGLIGRLDLGFLGLYAGGGYGYYIVPAFQVSSASGADYAESIDDISGWWGLAGVEAGIPSVKVFAEVKYSKIVERDVGVELEFNGATGALNADIDLSGPTYVVGLRVAW